MVKRFMFENAAIGKQTSIISEESGSKMALISGASQIMVKVDQLKGKTEIPETIEVELSTLIDVKGMKAMGNRLSQHAVKSIELLAEINPVVEEPEQEVEEKQVSEALESLDESAESPAKPTEQPHKKVDFEITNPDDIDIDNDGQLDLF